jgi:CheY-like chemotaxis protein
MTKPLALLLHEKLMPGSQLANKFEELDYRVVTLSDPAQLADYVRVEMPMIVVADLSNRRGDVLAAIAAMAGETATAHVPVIAYSAREDEKQRESALKAGVKILATDATITPHLPQFLEHALQID